MPVFHCSYDCGKKYKTYIGCVKHELSLTCTTAKRRKLEPEPYIVPEPQPQSRTKKATLEESIKLADDYDSSPLGKAAFCRQRGIPTHRLRHAYATRERIYMKDGTDIRNLTSKQLASQSFGSGDLADSDKVIDATMTQHLIDYMRRFRGPAPKGHVHYQLPEERILYQGNERLGVTVECLVDQVSLLLTDLGRQAEYDKVPDDVWARRIRDWCKRPDINISKRKFTTRSTTPEKEVLLANRCAGTLEKLSEVTKGICCEALANMDETSMRIFAMDIQF